MDEFRIPYIHIFKNSLSKSNTIQSIIQVHILYVLHVTVKFNIDLFTLNSFLLSLSSLRSKTNYIFLYLNKSAPFLYSNYFFRILFSHFSKFSWIPHCSPSFHFYTPPLPSGLASNNCVRLAANKVTYSRPIDLLNINALFHKPKATFYHPVAELP